MLGSDDDFWVKVGIDPVRIMTTGATYYTLRCYLDDQPVFLGRNGRISVFASERALARYLADEHDHDISNLATYDDIHTGGHRRLSAGQRLGRERLRAHRDRRLHRRRTRRDRP